MTPLIDLAFALLIIFMVTTPLLEQTIAVDLPVEAAKSQPEDREDFQALSIDRSGDYYWSDEQVSLEQLDVRERAQLNLGQQHDELERAQLREPGDGGKVAAV